MAGLKTKPTDRSVKLVTASVKHVKTVYQKES